MATLKRLVQELRAAEAAHAAALAAYAAARRARQGGARRWRAAAEAAGQSAADLRDALRIMLIERLDALALRAGRLDLGEVPPWICLVHPETPGRLAFRRRPAQRRAA